MSPQRVELGFGRNRIRKAGKTLRLWWQYGAAGEVLVPPPDGVQLPTWDEFAEAVNVLTNFRAAHGYPLQKARMGLKSMCDTVGTEHDISQRLKRHVTIIDKLVRYPTMRLESMQDVAGCRAILPSVEAIWAVQARWLRTKRLVREPYDYIAEPKNSGYRAVHLIVEYDDMPVEVQLRTRLQHEWAYTVERIGSRIAEDLKSGKGPAEVLEFFELVSEAMSLEEQGLQVPATLADDIYRARARARPLMSDRRHR